MTIRSIDMNIHVYAKLAGYWRNIMPNDNHVTPGHMAVLTMLVYKCRRVILSIVTRGQKMLLKRQNLTGR